MKLAILKYKGTQEGFGTVKSFDLYDVILTVPEQGEIVKGSTVTLRTVKAAGYLVSPSDVDTYNRMTANQ